MSSVDNLYSLGEAAERLHVHPTTLRRWAKQGDIAFVLTPGGHRRFPKSEVERLSTEAPRINGEHTQIVDHALTHTRSEIDQHRNEPWIQRLSESDRAAKRASGQALMGLMMRFIAAEEGDDADILAEVGRIGAEYGSTSREAGMPLREALQATLFFKDQILESVMTLPDTVRHKTSGNQRLVRRLNTFLNAIQLSIVEQYDPS
jgi:excisionase family DNA binding protein